jgi:hypothetical protein
MEKSRFEEQQQVDRLYFVSLIDTKSKLLTSFRFQLKDPSKNGFIKETLSDGSTFEGEYKNGLRHGTSII